VVQEADLTNALVFVDGVGLWFDFAVFFAANSPTLDTEVVYAIYHNDLLARQVRALYPDRACYLQGAKGSTRLLPCPF
jgi:hypothetical protein